MSINSDLKRMADSLEEIVSLLKVMAPTTVTATPITAAEGDPKIPFPAPHVAPIVAVAPVAVAPIAPVAVAPVAPVAVAPVAPVAVAPVAVAPIVLTDLEMNAAMVAELNRIGSRDMINSIMASLGVTTASGLTIEIQQNLLAQIRQIPPTV